MSDMASARLVQDVDERPGAVRDGARRPDGVLVSALAALALLGVLMVYSSSAAISLDRFGDPGHYLWRHVLHLALGVATFVAVSRLDYRRLDDTRIVHVAWAVVLLLLVGCFFEAPSGGARRWLRLGTLTLQPSELAKLCAVLLAAFQLARRKDRLSDPWRGLLPPVLLVGQLAILVALQPDFGTAAALLALLVFLAFVAGTPLRVLAGFGAVAGVGLAAILVQQPYRLLRLRSFLHPDADPLGAGFQLRQSLIALGTGGWSGRFHDGVMGTGFGRSLQKLFFLPEPHTDFVFSVIGEELGMIGTSLVVVLFAVVLACGLRIAARATDSFGTLLAAGATAMLSIQALLNVMVAVGLLPTKGLPLPFLSAGGSSLVASCAAAGLLLSVSRHG